MRIFEILTVISSLLLLLGLASRKWLLFRGRTILAVGALGFVVLHLLIEKPRWQMVPVYFLVGLVAIFWLLSLQGTPNDKNSRRRVALRTAGALAGILILLICAALASLFPVIPLPEPGGPFGVGTSTFVVTDPKRSETLTPDPSDVRQFVVDVWYPAQKAPGAQPAPMYPRPTEILVPLARAVQLPDFLFTHLALVQSHSYIDAAVAPDQGTYPVLLFSHAYPPGFSRQNTVQMEALASHGYVVFSISHTYHALVTMFPDGTAVPLSTAQNEEMIQEGEATMEIFPKLFGENPVKDPAERQKLFEEFLALQPSAQKNVQIWADDFSSMLDELEGIQSGQVTNLLNGHLDLERVGIFGMSFGGASSVEACLNEVRCKAVVNLDGFQFGKSFTSPIQQPYLMMYSEQNQGMNDFAVDSAQAAAYRAVVSGTKHFNYTDFALISPLFTQVGFTGTINPQRMETIMDTYLLAFFDQYLLGKETDFSALNARFPEVDLKVK